MSDQQVNPCLQECEDFGSMHHDIETTRSALEELCFFERQVDTSMHIHRNAKGEIGAQPANEKADLAGLAKHQPDPRILDDQDFMDTENMMGHSKLSRHRDKICPSPLLPLSLLVARPVGKNDYLSDPKAMEGYWKSGRTLKRNEFGSGTPYANGMMSPAKPEQQRIQKTERFTSDIFLV